MNSVYCPSPKEGLKNACQIVLITNRKLHTGFRLVPTSVTLNDLESRNSPILHYFAEFNSFVGRLHHSS